MTTARLEWSDLSLGLQILIIVLAAISLTALLIAARAWGTTPDEDFVGGNRWYWLPVLLVSIIGPIAFLALGRVKKSPTHDEAGAPSPNQLTRDEASVRSHEAPAHDEAAAPTHNARQVADLLYPDR